MESWPIQCTRILLSWNHDRPWIDPRQCNYWNQKGNNNKSDCGAFALTAAFLICSKVSLCKQYTYMDTLTLLQVDTPYNLIDNYMDVNSTSKLPPPMWVNLDWSWFSGEISPIYCRLSLHGWFLPCTTASAVKVSKTQTPEARQGSNLFVPPGSRTQQLPGNLHQVQCKGPHPNPCMAYGSWSKRKHWSSDQLFFPWQNLQNDYFLQKHGTATDRASALRPRLTFRCLALWLNKMGMDSSKSRICQLDGPCT